jgi:O-methyltransferase domain/Dimerisation domain
MTETDARAALFDELSGRIMGFMVSQAVYVAAKLSIPDMVADRPRTAADLAGATGANGDALHRLLRVLAGHGVFFERVDGSFENSGLSELLRDRPGSFRDFALIFGEEFYPALGGLLGTIRTGAPAFDAVFGHSYDDHLAGDRDASMRFNRFMAGGRDALAELIAGWEWRGDETVVDVGGGNGAFLQALLERRPGLRGVVFDLPHVVPEARERIRAAGLDGRCECVGGSFLVEVPAGGDVYVLGRILHGLDDARARVVLDNIREAMRGGGRVLIVEGVVAPPNEPEMKLMDLLMLALGGRERTEEEWRELLPAAGFDLARIAPAPYGSILDARRR